MAGVSLVTGSGTALDYGNYGNLLLNRIIIATWASQVRQLSAESSRHRN
jgi:hypothetical protein